MSEGAERVNFVLVDYGHEAAAKLLTARLWSPLQRHSSWVFYASLAVWLGGTLLWERHVGPLPQFFVLIGLAALVVWTVVIGARKKKLCWEAVGSSPTMSGPITLQIDRTGVTYITNASRCFVAWVPGVDVIKAADGLLITLGGFTYLPIPASAFENQAAQDAFLARAQSFVAPADGIFS